MSAKAKIGVLGASGYTGAELVRLLLRHPRVEIALHVGPQVHRARASPVQFAQRPQRSGAHERIGMVGARDEQAPPGLMGFASIPARMKRSISPRGQVASFTCGAADFFGAW